MIDISSTIRAAFFILLSSMAILGCSMHIAYLCFRSIHQEIFSSYLLLDVLSFWRNVGDERGGRRSKYSPGTLSFLHVGDTQAELLEVHEHVLIVFFPPVKGL